MGTSLVESVKQHRHQVWLAAQEAWCKKRSKREAPCINLAEGQPGMHGSEAAQQADHLVQRGLHAVVVSRRSWLAVA